MAKLYKITLYKSGQYRIESFDITFEDDTSVIIRDGGIIYDIGITHLNKPIKINDNYCYFSFDLIKLTTLVKQHLADKIEELKSYEKQLDKYIKKNTVKLYYAKMYNFKISTAEIDATVKDGKYYHDGKLIENIGKVFIKDGGSLFVYSKENNAKQLLLDFTKKLAQAVSSLK